LQRGYDQLIHDVALQDLDVTFALDRAGLVGADGATHAGNYDIAFLRCIPNMVVATPSDENETRLLLSTCYQHPGPASVRYPRGTGAGVSVSPGLDTVPLGRGIIRRKGKDLAVLVFGTLLPAALKAAEVLDLTVVDMRFVKPLDAVLVHQMAAEHRGLITLEEGAIMGGAGSAVTEALNAAEVLCPVLQLGLPDRFIDHGDQGALLAGVGLDAAGIERSIRARFMS
jgi:1-deoxy-D-xylulose-5-phosphate synthase